MTISRPPDLSQATAARPSRARDESAGVSISRRRGPSYRRILVIWFSLLVLAIGLALSALVFHGARASTTPLGNW